VLAPALVALAVAVSGPHSAKGSKPPATPDAPVREAYRLEAAALRASPAVRQRLTLPLEPPNRARLLSKALAALVERDARYAELTGQVGNVDSDPFLAGQDVQEGVLADLAIDVVRAAPARAEVRARFQNFEPRDVRFAVVLEDGRWVIDDVREGSVSLRAELARPYFCAEGWTEACVEEAHEEELPDSLDPAADPSAATPSAR
jgi:hypothetical protein